MALSFQLQHSAYGAQRAALKALVSHAAKAVFAHENIAKPDCSILLSDDAAIQSLNHDFRQKNKPTNVLAFPSDEKEYLGDIIVSLDTVAREAEEQGKTFQHHLTHLIVHACLHLLGHDHMKKAEAEAMEAKEIAILKKLGVSNPYE